MSIRLLRAHLRASKLFVVSGIQCIICLHTGLGEEEGGESQVILRTEYHFYFQELDNENLEPHVHLYQFRANNG